MTEKWTRESLTALELRVGWKTGGGWPVPEHVLLWASKLKATLNDLEAAQLELDRLRCIEKNCLSREWVIVKRSELETVRTALRSTTDLTGYGSHSDTLPGLSRAGGVEALALLDSMLDGGKP